MEMWRSFLVLFCWYYLFIYLLTVCADICNECQKKNAESVLLFLPMGQFAHLTIFSAQFLFLFFHSVKKNLTMLTP